MRSRLLPTLLLTAALGACVPKQEAPPIPPPAPVPAPTPPPVPTPTPTPMPPPFAGPGWTRRARRGTGSTSRPMVARWRFTVSTAKRISPSSCAATWPAGPRDRPGKRPDRRSADAHPHRDPPAQLHRPTAPGLAETLLAITLNARDPLFDAMAISKGRFAVEVGGEATLYVPSWPEVTRVIEDCR